MNPQRRTALLIRCSWEEAETIRAAAHRERRTLSGYVLNAVFSRIRYMGQHERPVDLNLAPRQLRTA
jgi:uncharacterized protein (DUF1778 family)